MCGSQNNFPCKGSFSKNIQKPLLGYALLCPALDYLPPNFFLIFHCTSQCSSHTTPQKVAKPYLARYVLHIWFCIPNRHHKVDTPFQRIRFLSCSFLLFGLRRTPFVDL